MTAPVLTKVEPGAGPACESTFTTSFYVPKEHWQNPAEPSEPVVFIDRFPAMQVYCRLDVGFLCYSMLFMAKLFYVSFICMLLTCSSVFLSHTVNSVALLSVSVHSAGLRRTKRG